jgi:hypothetical protein
VLTRTIKNDSLAILSWFGIPIRPCLFMGVEIEMASMGRDGPVASSALPSYNRSVAEDFLNM